MTVDGVETDIRALVEDEQRSWGEFQSLLACLSPEQAERPGYFLEGWSAKDLLAHVAGWLAEAGLVLEQIRVGTFDGKDMDIEGMNAVFLEANRPQPLRVVHAEAYASRTRLLHEVTLALSDVVRHFQDEKRLPADIDAMATAGSLVSMLAHVAAHRYGFEFWGIRTSDLRRSMARQLFWGLTGQKP